MALLVSLSEWLGEKKYFNHFGAALIVIVLTAVLANLAIIPSAEGSPAYDGIFTYVAPIAIFYLLLNVNMASIKKAGLPMVAMFVIGSIGITIGILIASQVLNGAENIGELHYAIAGMLTGTYTGGSINFNAIALHYQVHEAGNLYVGTVVIDNVMTAIWIVVTIAIPALARKAMSVGDKQKIEANSQENHFEETENMNAWSLGIVLFMGLVAFFISDFLTTQLKEFGVNVPSILILTTIALILAQIPWIQRLNGSKVLGLFLVYMFLAVIGAYCDLNALFSMGSLALTLIGFVSIAFLIHAIILFGIGRLFKQDWELLATVSQANVGGSTSALALAKSLKRMDLLLPAVLVGSLGNALGTYLGFLVANWLQ